MAEQVADRDGVGCQNHPLQVCSSGGGEFEPAVNYRFVVSPRGVMLAAVSFVSEKEAGFHEKAGVVLARELARALAQPCPH